MKLTLLFSLSLLFTITIVSGFDYADAAKASGTSNSRIGVDVCGDRLCNAGEEMTTKEKLGYYLLSLIEFDDSTVIQQSRFSVGGVAQQGFGFSPGSSGMLITQFSTSSIMDRGMVNSMAVPLAEPTLRAGFERPPPDISQEIETTPQEPVIDNVEPETRINQVRIGTFSVKQFIKIIDETEILPEPIYYIKIVEKNPDKIKAKMIAKELLEQAEAQNDPAQFFFRPCTDDSSLTLDSNSYSITDPIYITVEHDCKNFNSNRIDRVMIKVSSIYEKKQGLNLWETSPNSGIFSIVQTGMSIEPSNNELTVTYPESGETLHTITVPVTGSARDNHEDSEFFNGRAFRPLQLWLDKPTYDTDDTITINLDDYYFDEEICEWVDIHDPRTSTTSKKLICTQTGERPNIILTTTTANPAGLIKSMNPNERTTDKHDYVLSLHVGDYANKGDRLSVQYSNMDVFSSVKLDLEITRPTDMMTIDNISQWITTTDDTVIITIKDGYANKDSAQIESVLISFHSSPYVSDIESVMAYETGPHSGVFQIELPLPPPDAGFSGKTITAKYYDEWDRFLTSADFKICYEMFDNGVCRY